MNIVKTFNNKTGTDLTGKEGYFVKFDTDGLAVCSAITDKPAGVVVRGGETSSDVCVWGECAALCGGTVTKGNFVTPHTDGTVIDTSSSCAEVALALESGIADAWADIVFLAANNAVA